MAVHTRAYEPVALTSVCRQAHQAFIKRPLPSCESLLSPPHHRNMSSEAAPESAEGFKLPQPPYHLRPLLPSPILASKAPALPAPHAAGVAGWQCSTHLFPAAFPRSHALCISPAVPAPIVAPDERAQRVLDFAAWDEACAQWKIDEFYPPTSQAAALEDAKKLAAEQQKTPLWGVVQRWTNPSAAAQKDGIVIVAGHANGFHKECYEPYFTHLLEKSTVPLSEIWSMDTIDSGFSGVINQGKLGWTGERSSSKPHQCAVLTHPSSTSRSQLHGKITRAISSLY